MSPVLVLGVLGIISSVVGCAVGFSDPELTESVGAALYGDYGGYEDYGGYGGYGTSSGGSTSSSGGSSSGGSPSGAGNSGGGGGSHSGGCSASPTRLDGDSGAVTGVALALAALLGRRRRARVGV